MTKAIQVRVKKAENGETYWRVTAANGRRLATAGETFKTASTTRASFMKMAKAVHGMTDKQFAMFLAGLRMPITE